MNQADLSGRGLAFQAFGFGVVGSAIVLLLHGCRALEAPTPVCVVLFDATARVHWAFIPPLAWVFDWSRRMFEKREAIRDRVMQEMVDRKVEAMIQAIKHGDIDTSDPDKMADDLRQAASKNS